MSSSTGVLLGVQGVIFAAWAFVMFRTLFKQKRRATERTGKPLPGPIETLRQWGIWWRDPTLQSERRLLVGLTLALVAFIVISTVLRTSA